MGTPVTVLGGYLGAGKTTLLNAVLTAPHGLRIAVVVNDFGPVNIDAALIAERAGRRIDLTNGCVCCQAGTSLADACFELAEADPPFDRIVIETSGVADPGQAASWASLPGLQLDGVVVAVDPESIERLVGDELVGPTVRRQILAADLAVVTRADLVDAAEIDRVGRVLLAQGLAVPIVTSAAGAIPLAALFDLDRTTTHPAPNGSEGQLNPPSHVAAVWRPSGDVDLDLLRQALATTPGLVRAKGVVPTSSGDVVVHLAGRRISIEPWPPGGEHALVGIGHRADFHPASFGARMEAAAHRPPDLPGRT